MSKKIQEYQFLKKHEQIGFEIIRLNNFFNNHSLLEREVPHRIGFYAIVFITNGNGEHLIDFKIFTYQEKNILFIGKDQIHAWYSHNEVEGFIMFFTEDFLHENQMKFNDLSYSYNSILYKPIIDISQLAKYESFFSLIDYLYKEYNIPDHQNKQEILQCLLRTFLLKIKVQSKFKNNEVSKIDKELFIRFQRKINEKISISRNAKDYCEWLNVPYRKLNNTCKTLTNLSVKGVIDEIIILKAKKYLIDKDKNISDVSFLLGFQEVTNFTKFFKKHTNYSPKFFKKSVF